MAWLVPDKIVPDKMSVGQLFFAQKILNNFNFGACLLAKWHGTSGVNQTFVCKCLKVKCFLPKRHGTIWQKYYRPQIVLAQCLSAKCFLTKMTWKWRQNFISPHGVSLMSFGQMTGPNLCQTKLCQTKCLSDNCFLPKRHWIIFTLVHVCWQNDKVLVV
jgi:hypothetical protein